MATIYWINGTSGDWNTAADWESGIVPGATDVVQISGGETESPFGFPEGVPALVTVTQSAVAASLTLYDTTLTISGNLTLGTSLTFGAATDFGGYSLVQLSGGIFSAATIMPSTSDGDVGYGQIQGYGTISGAISGNIAVDAKGGLLKFQGSITGDQNGLEIEPNATLELVNGTSQDVLFDGTSAALMLDQASSFTGFVYNAAAGDSIDLVGITATSATYVGTLLTVMESNGQHLSFNVSGSVLNDSVAVAPDNNGGTLVSWLPPASSPPQDIWVAGISGDWSTAANWVSGSTPSSTDDAVINNASPTSNGPPVTVNGMALAHSLTLNGSSLSVSGTLTLGTFLSLAWSNESGISSLVLNGGTLSAQAITTPTNVESEISGYGTILGAISGDINVFANGGTLKVEGSHFGDQGTFTIAPDATLELSDVANVQFSGNPGTLKLDAPAAFTGLIQGLTIGDTIDLAGIAATSATIYTGTTLTINETNGQHLSYDVNNVPGSFVTVSNDNNGGTLVYWTNVPAGTPQYWITGASGDWSQAADWQSGMTTGSTAEAVINNSNAVAVGGAAIAESLILNNSALTVSGTLTLGTSLTLGSSVLNLGGGNVSAQLITTENGGTDQVTGYGTLIGAFFGDVQVTAAGGVLTIEGSLTNDFGTFSIDSGGLELGSATSLSVDFNASGTDAGLETLKLDSPTTFTGSIENISLGDTIDLVGIAVSTASYGTALTIDETNGQTLTYNVSGNIAGDVLTVASDGNGGTLVSWTTGLTVTLNSAKINDIYQAVFQRPATSSETSNWLASDASIGDAATVADIVSSPEAQFNVYPVIQIIDLATLAPGQFPLARQLASWVPFIEQNGVLTAQAQTNPLLDQMALAFVASDNFGKVYNNGVDVDPNAPITGPIVTAIIEHALGSVPTPDHVAGWVATGLTIDQVFVDFALGDQYTAVAKSGIQQYLIGVADNAAGIA